MIPGWYPPGIGKSDARLLKNRKALPRYFLCIFSSLYLLVGACFQQVGSSAVDCNS